MLSFIRLSLPRLTPSIAAAALRLPPVTQSEYFFARSGMDPSLLYGCRCVGSPVFSSVLALTHSSPSSSSFTSIIARSKPPSAM